jgi:endonuclease-3
VDTHPFETATAGINLIQWAAPRNAGPAPGSWRRAFVAWYDVVIDKLSPGGVPVARPRSRAVVERGDTKRAFDVDAVMGRIREAVRAYPPPALFALADDGFTSPFEQLVACILSTRTRDEVTEPTARAFLAQARTPAAVAEMDVAEIDRWIRPSTFHETKAPQLRAIAQRIVQEYGGELPCDEEVLLSFVGVGPKCANLVLGIACGRPRIAVDTHVHRITNRWGYVAERTPEQTLTALEARLPHRYWLEINRSLIPFGKHICTPVHPHCSTCPVLEFCAQVGVTAPR